MTILISRLPPASARDELPTPRATVPRRSRGVALFVALSALYFTVGYVLVMRYNLFDPDSTSRVANAGYVLESRDPHLSAIGFVWNPLPSLVEIPVLQLARWWPELRSYGIAAVVQSALFMAGAALMVRRIALDRGVGAAWRRIALACFALQPMIIVYGGSGMSEAAEVFCVLWCVRHLLRWVEERHVGDLALAGVALGVGYLARYEVVPAAAGAAALVTIVVFRQTAPSARLSTTAAHIAVVLFPIAAAAGIWALTGWVVNQELFATLTSRYGNDSQVTVATASGTQHNRDTLIEWIVISARVLGMQPFAGIAAAGALFYAVMSRRLAPLVPLVTFGPILAFAAWGEYTGTTFGWFRYYILAIPMVVCIALTCWTSGPLPHSPWQTRSRASRLAALLLTLSIFVGFPVTVSASLNPRIGNQQLQFGFNSLLYPDRFPAQDQWYRRLTDNDRVLAAYLDRLNLPDGSVLMDTFYTWGVWLNSKHPKQFIITSDYDFKAALNRPWRSGVKYMLLSNPQTLSRDAITARYPSMWYDGADLGDLVFTVYGANGEEKFRLYRITEPKQPGTDRPSAQSSP